LLSLGYKSTFLRLAIEWSDMQTYPKPPIAVVAMSGVFPKASSIEHFWKNIQQSVDTVGDIPSHRLSLLHESIFSAHAQADKAYSTRACLIREADIAFDGFASAALDHPLDPPSQWICHACRDAYGHGGLDDVDHQRIGVILAAIALPTAVSSELSEGYIQRAVFNQAMASVAPSPVSASSRVVAYPANLISRILGLGGGSYTIDAACASSLYAVKLACEQLQSFRCDAMISGGFSGADTIYTQVGFSQLKALSPSGRCAPFDHRADGLVVGEGVGILVLKRLDDAIRHGNTILGVIRGIGLSNDMRGNLLAPESAGQVRAMQHAYAQAGWLPSDVDYIECHGAGTPVGDATELKSLITLWKNCSFSPGKCALGSIKSMIGHLLTGAGAAGLIKMLLALHHKTLPPSLNFERPPADSPLIQSPFRVLTEPEPWESRSKDSPRRAAVSAFGFGGINGHVLLEEWIGKIPGTDAYSFATDREKSLESVAPAPESPARDVAIVGMDVHLGSIESIQSFREAVFNGRCMLWEPSAKNGGRIRSGCIDEITIEAGEFQIPPNEIPDILPQQLLMLKTALGAMKDAGLAHRQPRERMGAIIGISFDYQATNFHQRWCLPRLIQQIHSDTDQVTSQKELAEWIAQSQDAIGPPLTATRTLGALGGIVASRIAREFRFGGPSFVVSAEEVSGLRALEIGIALLNTDQCDTVLVGAVDLHCDERNLATLKEALPLSASGHIRPFDQSADGTLPGEGAVAMVLKRFSAAQTQDDHIYAVIHAIGAAGNDNTSNVTQYPSSSYFRSLVSAFENGWLTPSDVGYIESHGSAIPHQDDVEAHNLAAFFGPQHKTTTDGIAIGALKPLVGHCGAVSGLASVIKTALCLHHQILPPIPGIASPRQREWKENSLFYFPRKPTYWSKDLKDGPRVACTAAMTPDGECMHVVMSQVQQQEISHSVHTDRQLRPLGALPYALFCFQGNTKKELFEEVKQLSQLLRNSRSRVEKQREDTDILFRLAGQWYHCSTGKPQGSHTLSILAESLADLDQYLRDAPRIIKDNRSQTLNGRGGICYLPDFNIAKKEIAFVYPGSGNHYLGMGRTLAVQFPDVMCRMDTQTESLHSQLLPHWYDPRRTDWSEGWQSEAYGELTADPLRTIFGQVLFGGQMTMLLQDFGLTPDAVLGYSLGESAGLFALGAWPDRGQMLERLAVSNLFKTQLAGSYQALRQAWSLPGDTPVDWRVAVVNRPADEVDQVVAQIDHVRRLIINTPDECVIGGLAPSVKTAIKRLGSEAIYLDGVVAVHCDAAQPVSRAYRELHLFDTSPVTGVRFYSVAGAGAYSLTADAAADSILQQALTGFDFPRGIEQAYRDGIRIFLEIGPHNSCTRMIQRILADRPHLAVAANQRNEDECLTLLKCLATLAAAGIMPDLNPLYADFQDAPVTPATSSSVRTIHVPVRKPPMRLPDLPEAPIGNQHSESEFSGQLPHRVDGSLPTTISGSLSRGKSDSGNSTDLDTLEEMITELNANITATARAHEQFLNLTREMTDQFSQAFELQNQLIASLGKMAIDSTSGHPGDPLSVQGETPANSDQELQPLFSREKCMAFAVGSVGKVLGPEFDIIDTYPARVRLPDEPLMLVDRIMSIEGDKCSLGPGRIVTQHDVLPAAWYLDGGRAPVCISVEAGQADLFLSSYLGIDHAVKGQRTYRLLDASIMFHRSLPQPGETIQYDIHIDKFVKQGATYLFFFRFEGHIGNNHLITMTNGCAGFFTEQEVRDSGGIILTEEDKSQGAHINARPFSPLIAIPEDVGFNDAQVDALRTGDAHACFGDVFTDITLPPTLRLPSGRMRLIHRILTLQPKGGRFGLGYIRAEADIDPDDWFLTCHFVDDRVMPGTLMYECCAHTLRVLLLRLGWVTHRNDVHYEPLQGIACRLKCRGPVTPHTRKVHYAVEIKEIGYAPQPYVIADAHMYADGHYIVFFKDMAMQISGLTGEEIQSFWQDRAQNAGGQILSAPKPAVEGFDRNHILEFATGSPVKAFGEPYAPFDRNRIMARLPGPPYSFVHRITSVAHPAWQLKPSDWVEAQYDVPRDAWYFAADRSGVMPFSVLLEIALQPCGWLAAYAGSALRSDQDLKFRNLGGQGTIYAPVQPGIGTLTMRTRMTRVSEAADMIIEDFDFQVLSDNMMIFDGHTNFGFFTASALANQIGLRNVDFPSISDHSGSLHYRFEDKAPLSPDQAPANQTFQARGLSMPAKALRMIDTIEVYDPKGGPHGLGYIRGRKFVDPTEWFFKAHFYQDPVCPGSLGVESFLQLIKYHAIDQWPGLQHTHSFEPLTDHGFQWQYRGQIIPKNKAIVVDAVITRVKEQTAPVIMADGLLMVDGLCIYKLEGFGLRLKKLR